jgi:hypothetical protein
MKPTKDPRHIPHRSAHAKPGKKEKRAPKELGLPRRAAGAGPAKKRIPDHKVAPVDD